MGLLQGLMLYQTGVSLLETAERRRLYGDAYHMARALGKPLVVAGGHKGRHGTGDLCVDVHVGACRGAPVILRADIRDIPIPDKWAGAAFASHVLEHLPTEMDARIALGELARIADYVYIVSPHKLNILAWLHPDHHLWVTQRGHDVKIEQR